MSKQAGKHGVVTRLAGAISLVLITSLFTITEARSASENTLDIGFAAALSGYLAPFDQPVLNGMKIAIEEINAAGGIGGKHPINLSVKDVRSDTAQSTIA